MDEMRGDWKKCLNGPAHGVRTGPGGTPKSGQTHCARVLPAKLRQWGSEGKMKEFVGTLGLGDDHVNAHNAAAVTSNLRQHHSSDRHCSATVLRRTRKPGVEIFPITKQTDHRWKS